MTAANPLPFVFQKKLREIKEKINALWELPQLILLVLSLLAVVLSCALCLRFYEPDL